MPIVVAGLTSLGAARIQVVVSPLIELGSMLHVLGRPEHHGRDHWARDVHARMSVALAEQTRAWAWVTQAIRATPFVSLDQHELSEQIERMRRISSKVLAHQLLRPVSGAEDLAAARKWAGSRGPGVAALVDMLIDQPSVGVARFLDFLALTWREWFRDEWRKVQPGLVSRSRGIVDVLQAQGAVAGLSALDPALSAGTREGNVVIAKIQNRRHDVARRGLSITPSAFVHPHVYVADVPGQPLLLILPVAAESVPRAVPPASMMLSRLSVLAHPGRLEICRAIASEPRTAGEIAVLWHMDPTQVTRHLRSLVSTGLIQAQRRGRFVQYALDLEAIESLGVDLVRLLLR